MIRIREGIVCRVIGEREGIQHIEVIVEEKKEKAVVYTGMLGRAEEGDRVLLNTTACHLGLGTGGYHFVIANLDKTNRDLDGPGHIMKLRYTPLQVKCLSAEEQQSPWHDIIKSFHHLGGFPVVVATLHSMIGPICALIKAKKPKAKIGYVMTDGAALPIAFSNTIAMLKEKKLIETAITCGNAFGGDLEAVNFYTGIIASREIARCDIAIVAMGPGNAGTGTAYGFSGIEQGYIIDGVNTLGGVPVAVPRISFADSRERHRGISHHTLTVLGNIAKTGALVALPLLGKNKMHYILQQVREYGLHKKHRVVCTDGREVMKAMEDFGLDVTTMGRGIGDDPDYFLALGAAAKLASKYLV